MHNLRHDPGRRLEGMIASDFCQLERSTYPNRRRVVDTVMHFELKVNNLFRTVDVEPAVKINRDSIAAIKDDVR